MRFNIKKIEIENFRSIQDMVTLNIYPGLYSIEGINTDENSSGNGSGKSSLLSALYWCLTGNTLTNEVLADEVVNIKVGKNCRVTVYVDSEQGEIKITRTRKDSELGNNLLLEINGQDVSCHKIADTQARLNQLIKIPQELLKSTIIMTSGMESAFSELSPQQRVQALESIRDYSLWDNVRDTANKDIKDYNAEIQENNLQLSQYTGSINTYSRMIDADKFSLDNLRETTNKDVLTKRINDLKEKVNATQTSIDEQNEKLTKLTKEKENQKQPEVVDLSYIVDEANNLKSKAQNLEYDKRDFEKEVTLIDKWFKNDRCPTCNRLLDRTSEEIETKTNQRNALKIKINDLTAQIKDLDSKVTAKREEWSKANKKQQEQQAELLAKNKESLTVANTISSLTTAMNGFNRDISRYTLQLNSFDQKEAELKANIYKNEKEVNDLLIKAKDIEVVIKDLAKKKHLSDYFYRLLGSKGELRPYLLNKDIQFLNACMQKYTHVFFKNTDIELKLNGASIDINIDSNGIKKTVSSLSGGEKKRLNLAIQLGLYDLISSTAQISFNTLWLDEVESEVDQQGIQQLIQIIEDISEKVETVMWITNNPNVKEAIASKIICKKICGKTQVEVNY